MLRSKLTEYKESYAIRKFPFSKTDMRQETLTDFDCMAIKSARHLYLNKPGAQSILHLQDFIVDVGNMIAYSK